MPVKNIKTIRPRIHIPVGKSPAYKIEITRDDSTVDDITADIENARITLVGTTQLSSFDITLLNIEGNYTDKYDGGEYVDIYLDYNTGTTLYFRGRIDKPFYGLDNNKGFFITLSGRDYPTIADQFTTIQFSNASIVESFRGVSGTTDAQGNKSDGVLYNTGLTWHTSNPLTSSVFVTKNYVDISQLKIFADLAKRGSYNWYIYYDSGTWYLRLFTEGSVTNAFESVSFGTNLISMPGVGHDYKDEFNRIRIYGEEDENIFYLNTINDTSSQSNLWIKDKKFSDAKIDNVTEMGARTSYEIENNLSVQRGNIVVLPLTKLKPGEKIPITVPYCKVNSEYKIERIVTNLGAGGIKSTLHIEKESEDIATFLQELIDENEATSPYINLNDLNNTYITDFNNGDTGTHQNSKTEVVESGDRGYLRLKSGETVGTWISARKQTTVNVEKLELRVKGNYDIDDCTYYISGDNGSNWTTVELGTYYDLGPIGTDLKVKVILNSTTEEPNPKFEKICILYS